MRTIIISYSLTGNNEALALNLAAQLHATHIRVEDVSPRTMSAIVFDMLLNRTPSITPDPTTISGYELVIFVAPVWMGHVASPLRAFFKSISASKCPYGFVSISGGADGANPRLARELHKRMGYDPVALIDLHIADLLPGDKATKTAETSAYRITDSDVKSLTGKVIASLQATLPKLFAQPSTA